MTEQEESPYDGAIGVIGLALRFPGAVDAEQFWENLLEQKDVSVSFSTEELLASGVGEQEAQHPSYVPVNYRVENAACFDADFFDIPVDEAEILDPQHRLFLETAHHALEDAGYGGDLDFPVGVFGGAGFNTYLHKNLSTKLANASSIEAYRIMLANDKDFLTTRVSYKLNLKGPSVNVGTACSTGLVAVHLACQSLLNGECDVALVGCVSVRFPQSEGYMFQEGMIFSSDGRCRAFSEDASGTVLGDGVGMVVLKPLDLAVQDRDNVLATILGTAVNNDGAQKVGYAAPSAAGQASVIAEALAISGADPATVSYVETHGTGTKLGDPVEIRALKAIYGEGRSADCGLGSVKTNIGHLDTAAGMAGLIKTILCLRNATLVPTMNFSEPNPDLGLSGSDFHIVDRVKPWEPIQGTRRAGVSSFGVGGTNAHVVLQEAPTPSAEPSAVGSELILISAKTPESLEDMQRELASRLRNNDEKLTLTDVAFTLVTGRRKLPVRKALIASDVRDVALNLALDAPERVFRGNTDNAQEVVWIFGEPTYVPDTSALLHLPVFAAAWQSIDSELERMSIAPDDEVMQTKLVAFKTCYAMGSLLMACDVERSKVVAEGLGELVAGVLFGVLTLGAALQILTGGELPADVTLSNPTTPLVGGGVADLEVTAKTFWLGGEQEVRRFSSKDVEILADGAVLVEVSPSDVLHRCLIGADGSLDSNNLIHVQESDRPAGSRPEPKLTQGRTYLECYAGTDDALTSIMTTLGHLWIFGVEMSTAGLYTGRNARRVSLPKYAFAQQRHWVEAADQINRQAPLATNSQGGFGGFRHVNRAEQVNLLHKHLVEKIAQITGTSSHAVDVDQSILELALDSLVLVELVAELSMLLSISANASALIEHPTIAAFTTYVVHLVNEGDVVVDSLEHEDDRAGANDQAATIQFEAEPDSGLDLISPQEHTLASLESRRQKRRG